MQQRCPALTVQQRWPVPAPGSPDSLAGAGGPHTCVACSKCLCAGHHVCRLQAHPSNPTMAARCFATHTHMCTNCKASSLSWQAGVGNGRLVQSASERSRSAIAGSLSKFPTYGQGCEGGALCVKGAHAVPGEGDTGGRGSCSCFIAASTWWSSGDIATSEPTVEQSTAAAAKGATCAAAVPMLLA